MPGCGHGLGRCRENGPFFPQPQGSPGAENEEVKSRMKALKERFGKELKEVMEPFSTSQAEHLMDLHVMVRPCWRCWT